MHSTMLWLHLNLYCKLHCHLYCCRYMGLYFTRGSLTYTAPVMVGTKELGVSLHHIGAMTSAFPLAYGISKWVAATV